MKRIICALCVILLIFTCCLPAFAEDSQDSFVLLGDSISQGYGVYNRDEACYGRIIADTIGYSYTNWGVDGQRSWDLIDNLEKDTEIIESIRNADIISLSIGGNDFLQQNLPVIFFNVLKGDYTILNDIERNFGEYFAEIINIIKTLNPNAVLLVNRLYNPGMPIIRNFLEEAVYRVNGVIDGYYEGHSEDFYLIDPAPVMNGHPECVALDTIHPSAVGNVEIAKLILEALYNLGITTKTELVINAVGIDEIPYISYILRFFVRTFSYSNK